MTDRAASAEIDLRAILRDLTHAMTIRITEKRMGKLLYTRRGKTLVLAYENDDGSRLPDQWIPRATYRSFSTLGGSRDAFIFWLQSKGAKEERKITCRSR